MTFLTQWEKVLLSSLLERYESGDFNCGASFSEMKSVNCIKAEDEDIHLDSPVNRVNLEKDFLN